MQGVDVTATHFSLVRAVFVELFCTPKSSMENPSLRVNRYGGNINRTFAVEDFIEDEFGQSATDEVNREQSYVHDEGSCFLNMGQQRVCFDVQTILEPKLKKKGKGTLKGKGGSKEAGRPFLGEDKAQESELWSGENCAWWSKGKPGWKGGIRTNSSGKSSSSDLNPHKSRGKDHKGKSKEGDFPHSGFSASENHLKRDKVIPGNQTIGIPTLPTPQLQRQRGAIQGTLHGWHQFLGSCPPSDVRGSGSWLHTISWIEKGNQKVPEICVVLWHHDRTLPLQ